LGLGREERIQAFRPNSREREEEKINAFIFLFSNICSIRFQGNFENLFEIQNNHPNKIDAAA